MHLPGRENMNTEENIVTSETPEDVNGKTPTVVRITQGLFFLNAAIWTLFGIITLLWALDGSTNPTLTVIIVGGMMFAYVAVVLFVGWGLGKQTKRFFILAVATVVVTIILTITDQFGRVDFTILVLNAGILVLLLVTRDKYLA
jgi:hypothetical protein